MISALLRASEHSQTLNPSFPKTPLNPQASKEDVILSLRRLSKAALGGPPRSASAYRGVSLHQKGKWEARIGLPGAKKYKCALRVWAPALLPSSEMGWLPLLGGPRL